MDNDLVFFFGDLNFRNQNDYYQMVRNLIEYEQSGPKKKEAIIDKLLKDDQLEQLKKEDKDFIFKEQPINFLPTYKFKCKCSF
jgi:hypothetical protein